MFYNNINLPKIIEVGNNKLESLDEILLRHHLYFKEKILVTSKKLYELYENNLKKLNFSELLFIESSDITEKIKLERKILSSEGLIMGFGGGQILDIVKLFSSEKSVSFISIPSALSNDGIYSPISRINVQGKKLSYGVKAPLGIIVDLKIVRESPRNNILAGVGDLISNIGALEDWDLACRDVNENKNDLAYSLSLMSANSLIDLKETDITSEIFLERLTYGLILSGLSMSIAGNSRPASGSEHHISHVIDEYYPEKSTLHGIQVAYGLLLIEERIRHKNFYKIKNYFDKVGVSSLIDETIYFTEDEADDILDKSITIRNRYTILNKLKKLQKVG